MATHSSVLAWRIPWIEEPGGLPSTGSHRVRHDLATEQQKQELIYNSALVSIIQQHESVRHISVHIAILF